MLSKQQFTYLNITLDYDLIREKRKSMMIRVKPDQSIVVSAPLGIKDEKIQDFIQQKLSWILRRRHHCAKFKPVPPKLYVNGENFRYLGQEYQLQIENAVDDDNISVQGNKLMVYSRRPRSRLYTSKLLNVWYAREAAHVFKERLKLCAERFSLPHPPNLAIRDMTSRHGSYSTRTNRVCLNLKLIKFDLALIDYIIIHELCHITHHAHNRDFYDLLESYLPQWKQLESKLRSQQLSG